MREMKEELGVDVVIKSIGDEKVWGMTDDNVDGKLWRCTIYVVEQVDESQQVNVSAPLLCFPSTLSLCLFGYSNFPKPDT